jgi:hypothetical protein
MKQVEARLMLGDCQEELKQLKDNLLFRLTEIDLQ